MAVVYERVRGRGRVRRSKPSKRLDQSKRWRRVADEPAGQSAQPQDGQPQGELGRPDAADRPSKRSESNRGS